MAEAWSAEEVAATVADYFSMLDAELRGESYNKAEHNRHLQGFLKDRSGPSVEFKHANISAVMIELGLPYIAGYKPRGNYQHLLKTEIEQRLQLDATLQETVAVAVGAQAPEVAVVASLDSVIVPMPTREKSDGTFERLRVAPSGSKRINYLEREAQNASLGQAGELFALAVEHRRLWEVGERGLADRIEHVAQSQGDGLGYDILSFEADGRERLIEVKTTRFGVYTPFFASKNEVAVSQDRAEQYALYRVFDYRAEPRLFIAAGSLRDQFDLEPVQYQASVA